MSEDNDFVPPPIDWEGMETEELLDRYGIIRANAGVGTYQMNQLPIGSVERSKRNDFVLACFANADRIKKILLSRLTT